MARQKLNLQPIGAVCGKRRFYVWSEADALRRRLEAQNRSGGGTSAGLEVLVYYCERCNALHVGRGS